MAGSRFRWFGHVWRRQINYEVKGINKLKSIPIARRRGRTRKIIRETIKKDLEVNSLDKYMI